MIVIHYSHESGTQTGLFCLQARVSRFNLEISPYLSAGLGMKNSGNSKFLKKFKYGKF